MANNPSRKASPNSQSEPKVFDVMRPGRTPVSATSRPVIVGHKPQVKDPMMSKDADDRKRSLMNANQKITVQPLSGAGGITMDAQDKNHQTPTEPEATMQTDLPSTPSLDDALSNDDAQSTTPPAPDGDAPAKESSDMPEPWTPSTPDTNSTSSSQDDMSSPSSSSSPMPDLSDMSANDDLSPDDLTAMNTQSTPPASSPVDTPPNSMPETSSSAPEPSSPFTMPPSAGDQKPLPQLPEEHPDHDMIVSHHSHGTGMTILWIVIIVVVALIVFNFLLDLEIITIDSFPHTDLL